MNFAHKKTPLFSICTEVTNREKTIIRTIESIRKQTFEDYEYIIIDNASDDKSYRLISEYLSKYENFKKKVTFLKKKNRVPDIESWNSPIRLAVGKYIVICEGDDYFMSNHLKEIYNIVSYYPKVGLIVTPNSSLPKKSYSEYLGINSNKRMFKELINFNFCPPPSETIFLRVFNNQKFLFDQKNFFYAGEFSLYEKILQNNIEIYVNNNRTVHRGIKRIPTIKNYTHIQDSYFCFHKWSKQYDKDEERIIRKKLLSRLANILVQEVVWLKLDKKVLKKFCIECWITKNIPFIKLLNFFYIYTILRLNIFLKR